MSWLAVLVALSVGVALPSPAGDKAGGYGRELVVHHHKHKAKRKPHKHRKVTPRATPTPVALPKPGPASGGGGSPPAPVASPTPGATATPTPTAAPTPTATPTLYTRTGVTLNDANDTYTLHPTRRDFAHGSVEFNANNVGMDDHNLTIRHSGGGDVGSVFLASGDSQTLVLALTPGAYTLYCSIANHEQLGMRYDVTVY